MMLAIHQLEQRDRTTGIEPTMDPPGPQIDHYEVIEVLGRGGMGRVYKAIDLHNQRTVVLKFPDEDLIGDIATFERYRREKEIGSRLTHPHIQRALNVDEKRSDDYLVAEYIEGRTLRAVLSERGGQPLPVEEA